MQNCVFRILQHTSDHKLRSHQKKAFWNSSALFWLSGQTPLLSVPQVLQLYFQRNENAFRSRQHFRFPLYLQEYSMLCALLLPHRALQRGMWMHTHDHLVRKPVPYCDPIHSRGPFLPEWSQALRRGNPLPPCHNIVSEDWLHLLLQPLFPFLLMFHPAQSGGFRSEDQASLLLQPLQPFSPSVSTRDGSADPW